MTLADAIKNHLESGGTMKDTMAVYTTSEVLRLHTTVEMVGQLLKGGLPVIYMDSEPNDLVVNLDI